LTRDDAEHPWADEEGNEDSKRVYIFYICVLWLFYAFMFYYIYVIANAFSRRPMGKKDDEIEETNICWPPAGASLDDDDDKMYDY